MKAQKEDCFLRGRLIAYLIYEYFRVTGANDSVENYADLFTIPITDTDSKVLKITFRYRYRFRGLRMIFRLLIQIPGFSKSLSVTDTEFGG